MHLLELELNVVESSWDPRDREERKKRRRKSPTSHPIPNVPNSQFYRQNSSSYRRITATFYLYHNIKTPQPVIKPPSSRTCGCKKMDAYVKLIEDFNTFVNHRIQNSKDESHELGPGSAMMCCFWIVFLSWYRCILVGGNRVTSTFLLLDVSGMLLLSGSFSK